jgi:hypothetical protein
VVDDGTILFEISGGGVRWRGRVECCSVLRRAAACGGGQWRREGDGSGGGGGGVFMRFRNSHHGAPQRRT